MRETIQPDDRFLSPLRNEKRPSFHIHAGRNVWYDFGDGRGGNTLDFACAYLESRGLKSSVPDALAYLQSLMGSAATAKRTPPIDEAPAEQQKTLDLVSLVSVRHPALVQYLQARGISVEIARAHLKQASVKNRETGKRFFALAFKNEEGGYELRNLYFKGAIAPKGITFIRGSVPKPDGIHVFEGMMDFLTVLTCEKTETLLFDALVLNSLSMLERALPYMKDYGYKRLFSWMDNDASGDKATMRVAEFVRTEKGLTHHAMNQIYSVARI